ncbi:tRNA (adenosine(37)-N6)-threonylcarbamoyltransferase complex ATPase subunit type 1 TsaE [Anaeroselena agilis]|uniref:tRNA threonylcarbamoyladenosine biosynthesis protein TsaE n=1 Tax=Anaeroselena agilis TaxID=3063788 RepID=A0ABU3NUC3_9FIRM|nr:tRNA (adenosine(37)-N6)-threonylcarbamoyltransferase complex ATPase subunit type 1 TsaE [Selenomonadales bacterium 4137-cl]
MLTIKTHDPAATRAFGRTLGRLLGKGDVVCLTGDLGAGKTLLVQGIAAGLGVSDDVTSPTFTILQVYETGRLPLYHFDLYRLDSPEELDNIGFAEYTGGDGAAVIEWADKFPAAMPEEHLLIELNRGDGESDRRIQLTPAGGRYRLLCEELSDKC